MKAESLSRKNMREQRNPEKAVILFDLISRALYSTFFLKKENDG